MRCLVTGAAGFIGSHLCDALVRNGHEVLGFDNLVNGRRQNTRGFNFERGDARSEQFRGHKFDVIFHLAAMADIVPSIEQPKYYLHCNVGGTTNMLEVAKRMDAKFIYAASSSCYGDNPPLPTTEDAKIDCKYPYALSKWLGERCVLHWGEVYGLNVTSLRLFNVYGPRARTSGTYGAVFGVFLAQLYHNIPLTIVGDGTQSRDFTHVRDVVAAFLAAAYRDCSGDIINVASGNPRTVNELSKILGAKHIEYLPKRPGEPDCTWGNIFKAKEILNWEPKVSFEEGCKELLSQLEEFKDAPLWTPKKIEAATKSWFEHLGDQ